MRLRVDCNPLLQGVLTDFCNRNLMYSLSEFFLISGKFAMEYLGLNSTYQHRYGAWGDSNLIFSIVP